MAGPDTLSLRRWFLIYAAWLLALVVPAGLLLGGLHRPWQDLFLHSGDFTLPQHQVLKLLILAAYFSVCTTFVPLPTTWLVAGLATAEAGIARDAVTTAAVLATVGALASTMANSADFHVFTWLLRSRRVGRVRETVLYERSAAWFARRPFWLLVLFSIVPVPVDVVRMLAATYRYRLRSFLAANFVGRWVRYAVVAGVTFLMGPRGWMVSLGLLAAAVVLGGGRLALSGIGRLTARRG